MQEDMGANMDKIASIEKLQRGLERLNITEDYTALQNLITELHFVYQSYVLTNNIPELSDQRTLWDIAYYLLTKLTNPNQKQNIQVSEIKEGLAISGLVFELLGLWAETQGDQELKKLSFLNAAISDCLSSYEANSAVLANRYFTSSDVPGDWVDFRSGFIAYGNNIVFALLGRQFLWLQNFQPRYLTILEPPDRIQSNLESDPNIGYSHLAFWQLTIYAVLQFSGFMFGGDEANYEAAKQLQLQARSIARDYEFLQEHWLASKLVICYEKMVERSTWRVLRAQGFSEEYISTLTRLPWNPVYEFWESQISSMTDLDNPENEANRNILSDEVSRAIISMPTSAGKTLIAELLIVKTLEENPKAKCVYVAPSRALVDEIENKLHRRLRFLGYRVASIICTLKYHPVHR